MRVHTTKKRNMPIMMLAIAGPTASGKTMLAQKVYKALGAGNSEIISQDHYYKDWAHKPIKKRKAINFDHPQAFDFALMREHLMMLKNGSSVDAPRYSFILSKRLRSKKKILPGKIFIVEGLYPYYEPRMRGLFDLMIYVDIDVATALARRLKRDINERGETIDSVCEKYFNHVLPMQKKYVEKQKWTAGYVFDGARPIDVLLRKTLGHLSKLRSHVKSK